VWEEGEEELPNVERLNDVINTKVEAPMSSMG
jgi:hypothetical protein